MTESTGASDAPSGDGSLAATGSALPGSLDPVAEAGADAAGLAQSTGRMSVAKLNKGALSWALYEGGRDPYVILITIYIFGPYFAHTMVDKGVVGAVGGQELVATIGTIYGLFVALTGPLLGASIDRFGARKPMLFGLTALMVPLIAALWWAKPDGSGLSVTAVAVILGVMGALFAYTEVIHNSLLTRTANSREAPHASGLALSAGNFFSVFSLIFVLWAFALPGSVPWSWVPKAPLFGLSKILHEPDRVVGLIAAGLLLLGSIPLFLFTPDAPGTGVSLGKGVREGFSQLIATLKSLKGQRDVSIYLGSRMLFTDGMTALLMFGGIYASGVMGWGVLEMLAYGILLSIFAVLGGFIGAGLDAAVGPKRAVQIEVGGAFLCLLGSLGMARDKILFLWAFDPHAHAPLWNGPMFRTAPEVIYLVIAFGTAIFVTAHYASSRTLLTRLTPPGQTASFFGLYALSGTVTVWLGSLLVKIFTSTFHTLQAGFAPIAGLLVLGFLGMLFVQGGNREA
ncbi:MAG: transporter [Caulobacter sp.]|nr:transporter [Caulobacter sp.]